MPNLEKGKEIIITAKFGNYGKVLKYKKKKNLEDSLLKLGAFKTFLIIVGAIAFVFGAYLITTRYLIPFLNDTVETTIYVEASEEPMILYDETTGYPIYNQDEYLFLVNSSNPLSEDYEVDLIEYENVLINEIIEYPLQDLLQSALSDGIVFELDEAYVSPEEQAQRYEDKVEELLEEGYTTVMSKVYARNYVAYAYEADEQTGLCVALVGDTETFSQTDEYLWLVNNMAEYGFVFRYPEGKDSYTGYEANLLIIRYVGVDNAIKMRQLSMCLEEYIEYKGN